MTPMVADPRLPSAVYARRARFAALLHRLVGMSAEQAERLFRPLDTHGTRTTGLQFPAGLYRRKGAHNVVK